MTDDGQPRGSAIGWGRAVVLGENTPHQVLVDLDAERLGELLGDSGAAKARVARLHLDDGVDELLRRALGSGLAQTACREQPPVLSLLERLVELEERGNAHDDRHLGESMRPDEQGPDPEQSSVRWGEIGRPVP